ncbi:AAA family ATPase [Streptomyces sp. NPDC006430]|uniref:ATP-binding protein n=1 Tax=Streptomyces sp. NPDC006430 TaxID=3154299 RepID=UPI0033AC799C
MPADQPKRRAAPVLIGRERELDAIEQLFCDETSRSTAVLVRGEAGSGKSALLRAAVEAIRKEGDTVVSASGDMMESGFAYGVVRQMFEHLGRTTGSGPDSPLSGHAAGAAHLLGPPGPRRSSVPASRQDEEILSSLYWLAVNLTANGRLIVVIDDLQWADPASVRWLHFLLRRAGNLPLVVLASIGPDQTPDHTEVRAAVLRLFPHQLALRPLADDAVAAVAQDVLGTAAETSFLTACRAATGGNLFLLQALLRTVRASGATPAALTAQDLTRYVPAGVGRALHSLIRNSGPHPLATAQALVVLDGSADTTLVAGVAGLADDAALDAVHGLVRAGLMTRSGDVVAFACPVLAAAFADEVAPGQRHQLHARAARLLLAQDAPVEDVAAHLLRAPLGIPGAAEVLRTAAAQAMRRSVPEDAVALLRRALREVLAEEPRASLLIALGTAELSTSVPDAVRHLRRGLELSRNATERTAAARALARALFTLDQYPEGLAVLKSTGADLRPVDSTNALRLEIDFLYGSVSLPAPSAAAVERLHTLQISDANGGGAERPLAALLSVRALMAGKDPDEVTALARQALDRGQHPADAESLVHLGAVLALGAAGQAEAALTHADAAADEARARGSALAYAYAVSTRARLRCWLGQVLECRDDARTALAALDGIGVDPRSTHSVDALATLVDAQTKRGRIDEAAGLLERGGLTGDLNGHWINDHVLLVRGRLRMAQGRTQDGLADFLLSGHRAGARQLAGAGVLPWRTEAALAYAALGDRNAALALATEELALARSRGVPDFEGSALRALGLVTGGAEGWAMLRDAVGILEGTAAKYHYARASADCGAHARTAGDLGEARIHLQQAVSVAHRIGATVVAEGAMAELRALGDRPRTRAFHGVDSLTPTERRVADLAALGMTNREIAQHLFVGLRTVEVHLTHAYRKLDIDGRRGLAQALTRTEDR